MDIKKAQADYRRKKSGAFGLVKPSSLGKWLYYKGRADYKETLIKLLLDTVDTLKKLGISVKITIDNDQEQSKQAA